MDGIRAVSLVSVRGGRGFSAAAAQGLASGCLSCASALPTDWLTPQPQVRVGMPIPTYTRGHGGTERQSDLSKVTQPWWHSWT